MLCASVLLRMLLSVFYSTRCGHFAVKRGNRKLETNDWHCETAPQAYSWYQLLLRSRLSKSTFMARLKRHDRRPSPVNSHCLPCRFSSSFRSVGWVRGSWLKYRRTPTSPRLRRHMNTSSPPWTRHNSVAHSLRQAHYTVTLATCVNNNFKS